MIRPIAVGVSTLALVAVASCGTPAPPALAWTCATTDTPPIHYGDNLCPADKRETAELGESGITVRWYSARADDVDEPDEQPVVGQALDGDWWDPAEQADVDDTAKRSKRVTTAPKTTTKPKATTAAKATPAKPKPTTRSTR